MNRPTLTSAARLCRSIYQICLLSVLVLCAATLSYAAGKEKIKIEKFSLNRSVAYLGEEITASVTVSSPLSLRSKKSRLRFFLGKDEIGTQSIPSFDSSGTARSQFKFKATPEGRFQFIVVLEVEEDPAQGDEVSRQLAILSLPGGITEEQFTGKGNTEPSATGEAPGKPDLEPQEIQFDIASPEVGQKVKIKGRISNTGPVQADDIKIRVFINGQPHGKDITMSIGASSEAEIETDYLPASQGKKDVLLLINPDGEIDEKSNRNNLLSKTLFVRPRKKAEKKLETVATREANSEQSDLPNLVVYIETISDNHFTTDGQVNFYVTNNSQTSSAGESTMGIQQVQSGATETWLLKKPVKELKPGETVALTINWPAHQISTNKLFVATVDIEGVIDETETGDNNTRPFRVISTSVIEPAPVDTALQPSINVTRPRQDEALSDGSLLNINWEAASAPGERVRISIFNSTSKEKILSSVTGNDGAYSIDLSNQKAGTYSLIIESEDETVSSSETSFSINPIIRKSASGKSASGIDSLVTPVAGSSYRGEQLVKVSWNDKIKKQTEIKLDIMLLESSSSRVLKINSRPIAAAEGEYNWQMPDDGRIFGVYTLQLRAQNGDVLAATDDIVFLPNFVSFESQVKDSSKKDISTDLEIARIGFNGPHLELLILNNGPAEITRSGMSGYNFTTYFVRKTPIQTEADLVICQSEVTSELPTGEGLIVSLGRDPDCPLGERNIGSKFEYAVSRFTLPNLSNQFLIDPRPLNNLLKFYWPE